MDTSVKEMEVVLEYEKLVHHIIQKYYSNYYDPEDLYQVGMIGLISAYRNFDASFGVKFSTYAYSYIRGEMSKHIREDKSIKVSKDMVKLKQTIEKTREILTQKLGRVATDTEIALFLDIDEERIQEVNQATEFVRSIYEPICEDGKEIALCDTVKQEENGYKAELIDLKTELEQLPIEERMLIQNRYFEGRTQQEISKILGISQVQVSRKETKVLEKLKQHLVA